MTKDRKLAIEKIAESVRVECNISDYGFKDIFDASEKMGYRIIRYPIGSDDFLGFAMIKEAEKIIFTNSSLILSREIFSLAHEIGHHKLHLYEQGLAIIKDDDILERNAFEVEANYFAACLLMPIEKISKYIRLELKDKNTNNWDGFDIAKIQTAFYVSYETALIRLKQVGILDDKVIDRLKLEKAEQTASKLLSVIGGNVELCRPNEVKKVPAEFLEWVIFNFNAKLIPKKSLETALEYIGLKAEDIDLNEADDEEDVNFDDLFKEMD